MNSDSDYIGREPDTGALEIYEQIKKQADELSTSEGSIQLFKNLSNPTNLTNPQIVGVRKVNIIDNTKIPSLSNMSKENLNKSKIKPYYKAKSHRNLRKELLSSNQERNKKVLFEKEYKSKDNKRTKNKEKELFKKKIENRNIDYSRIKEEGRTIIPKKIILDPIWAKAQTSITFKKIDKDVRIDRRKNTKIINYIDNSKEISSLKYTIKHKIERFNRLKRIKDSELFVVENTLSKIEDSKKYIENNYYSNFISYIIFLNKNIENETKLLREYTINEHQLKYNINKLNKMITKLIKQKYNILLWMSLQIQIKEKLVKFPEHYFKILEKYDNYKIFNNKKISKVNSYITASSSSSSTINLETLNPKKKEKEEKSYEELIKERILNYRNNIIYDTADEFLKQYDLLENKWLNDTKIYENTVIEINSLKKEYLSSNEIIITEEYKNLIEKLAYMKKRNVELKLELEKLKSIKIISLIKNNKRKSKLSNFFLSSNEMNKNNNINNRKIFMQKNHSNSFLEVYSNSNKDLFSLIMILFHLVKQNNFIKFETKSDRNINLIEIFNYIENVINLILDEKRKYLNNPMLSKIYENIENIIIKENKKLKLLGLIKKREFKQNEKAKQITERMNRQFYSPTRQIDYSFFDHLNKKEKNKELIISKKEKSNNRPPSFEDFMYDL